MRWRCSPSGGTGATGVALSIDNGRGSEGSVTRLSTLFSVKQKVCGCRDNGRRLGGRKKCKHTLFCLKSLSAQLRTFYHLCISLSAAATALSRFTFNSIPLNEDTTAVLCVVLQCCLASWSSHSSHHFTGINSAFAKWILSYYFRSNNERILLLFCSTY